jgi:hypothetical protein
MLKKVCCVIVDIKPTFLEICALYDSVHLDFGVPRETKHDSAQGHSVLGPRSYSRFLT